MIKRAKAVLKTLEDEKGSLHRTAGGSGKTRENHEAEDGQISLLDIGGSEIAERLKKTDLNTLTPLEALSLLFELKKDLQL